jgi:ferredoxin
LIEVHRDNTRDEIAIRFIGRTFRGDVRVSGGATNGCAEWFCVRHNMNMRAFRLLVASFLLLWLPLQGVATVTMPFCDHPAHAAQSAHPVVGADESEEHDVDRSGNPLSADTGHHHDDGGGSFSMNCNDCGACHLACSPAAPMSALVVADQAPGEGYVEFSATRPPLFTPEPRKRPPLAAIA